jgi:hypothetical protein
MSDTDTSSRLSKTSSSTRSRAGRKRRQFADRISDSDASSTAESTSRSAVTHRILCSCSGSRFLQLHTIFAYGRSNTEHQTVYN